jgi:hypothetical protein
MEPWICQHWPCEDREVTNDFELAGLDPFEVLDSTRSYFRMLDQRGPLFHEVIVRCLVWGGLEALSR